MPKDKSIYGNEGDDSDQCGPFPGFEKYDRGAYSDKGGSLKPRRSDRQPTDADEDYGK